MANQELTRIVERLDEQVAKLRRQRMVTAIACATLCFVLIAYFTYMSRLVVVFQKQAGCLTWD